MPACRGGTGQLREPPFCLGRFTTVGEAHHDGAQGKRLERAVALGNLVPQRFALLVTSDRREQGRTENLRFGWQVVAGQSLHLAIQHSQCLGGLIGVMELGRHRKGGCRESKVVIGRPEWRHRTAKRR